jgi:hypothetical protein
VYFRHFLRKRLPGCGRGAEAENGPAKILAARDGTETTVEEKAAPIANEAGNSIGVVLVFRDIDIKMGQK